MAKEEKSPEKSRAQKLDELERSQHKLEKSIEGLEEPADRMHIIEERREFLGELKKSVDREAFSGILNKFATRAADPEYSKNIRELVKSGLVFDERMVHALYLEKGRNSDYISVLKNLHAAGCLIDNLFIEDLSLLKAADKKYIDALIKCAASGIKINNRAISIVPEEYLYDEDYLNVVRNLYSKGFDYKVIGTNQSSLLEDLTPAKAKDERYLAALGELKEAGIFIDAMFIKGFDLYMALDKEFLESVKKVSKAGMLVDWILLENNDFYRLMHSSEAVNKLMEFAAFGILRDSHLFSALTKRGSTLKNIDINFIRELVGAGVRFYSSMLECLIERFDDWDASWKSSLVKLARLGVPIDYDVFYGGPIDTGKIVFIEKAIKSGIEMNSSIVGWFRQTSIMEVEEQFNEFIAHCREIQNMKILSKDNNSFGAYRLYRDKNYFDNFKRFREAGFETEFILTMNNEAYLGDPSIIEFMKKLQPYRDQLIYATSLRNLKSENIKLPGYKDKFFALAEAGFPIKTLIAFNSNGLFEIYDFLERNKDAILRLRGAGAEIDDLVSCSDLLDNAYVEALIDLAANGVVVSEDFLLAGQYNLREIIKDPQFRDYLKDATRTGLKVDYNYVVHCVPGQYADERLYAKRYALLRSEEERANIFRLQLNYVDVFRLESANLNNPIFCANILAWRKMGIMRDEITYEMNEKLKDPVYNEALKHFWEAGIEFYEGFVESFTPQMAADGKFVDNLIQMHKNGINIRGIIGFLYAIKSDLDVCLPAFLRMREIGLIINGETVPGMNASKVVSEDFNKLLSALGELKAAGIDINSFPAFTVLYGPKAESKTYIKSLIHLHKCDAHIGEFSIDSLPLEKGEDEEYISALDPIIKNAKSFRFTDLFAFDEERAKNPKYMDLLVRRVGSKGNFDYRIVESTDLEYVQESFQDNKIDLYNYQAGYFNRLYEAKKKVSDDPLKLKIIEDMIGKLALPFIRSVNDLHNETDEVRQREVRDLPLEGLYALVTHGVEELFTSSFQRVIFPIIMEKMQAEGLDAVDLINEMDPARRNFRLFMQVFSKYNRVDAFLSTVKSDEKLQAFMHDFIFGLDAKDKGLENAVAISETLELLQKNKNVTARLEAYLKEAFETSSGHEKIMYGIIASQHSFRAQTNKEFFEAQYRAYPVENSHGIKAKELLNKKGENIQWHFFYNDQSGKDSFNNMMKIYRRDETWSIEDKGKYMLLTKAGSKGVKILKYVNKPENEGEAEREVQKALIDKDLSAIEIVHRGHSYHTPKTLQYLPPTARIVYLGGCGGFQNVSIVLGRAQKAHIISTKGTGGMEVNDPLLKMLDEMMLKGNGVDWRTLWGQAEQEIKHPLFREYVSPERNAAAIFVNTYRKSISQP